MHISTLAGLMARSRLLPREVSEVPTAISLCLRIWSPRSPPLSDISLATHSRVVHWPDADWESIRKINWHRPLAIRAIDPAAPRFLTMHDSWVDATEQHQCEVISAWVSHLQTYRVCRPTGGFCVRALNDHTTENGWGVIDVHGNRRPSLFEALQSSACQPVDRQHRRLTRCESSALGRLSVAVHVSSDLRHHDLEGAVVDVAVWGTDSDSNLPVCWHHRGRYGKFVHRNESTRHCPC